MRGEFWDFEIYSSKVVIEKDGKLVLNESTMFTRHDRDVLDVIFGDNKFYLRSYWYSDNAVNAKKAIYFRNVFGGPTEMANDIGFTIKALSNDLNDLKKLQGEIWRVFRKTEEGMEVPELRMY